MLEMGPQQERLRSNRPSFQLFDPFGVRCVLKFGPKCLSCISGFHTHSFHSCNWSCNYTLVGCVVHVFSKSKEDRCWERGDHKNTSPRTHVCGPITCDCSYSFFFFLMMLGTVLGSTLCIGKHSTTELYSPAHFETSFWKRASLNCPSWLNSQSFSWGNRAVLLYLTSPSFSLFIFPTLSMLRIDQVGLCLVNRHSTTELDPQTTFLLEVLKFQA